MEIVAATCFGLIVGLALGLTGGGGSIFAVPMLIYGLSLSPTEAVPISLVAVGMTALVGALHSIRAKLIVWQPAILFALGGVLGAPGGLAAARYIDEQWIVGGFATLAVTVGTLMWLRARNHPEQSRAVRAEVEPREQRAVCALSPDGRLRFSAPCAVVLTVVGLLTGFLSGLLGVGGGFLIVPALVFVTRISVHAAVGTSLLIISAIGLSGAATSLIQGSIDWAILLPFLAGGAVSMLAARRFARRIAGPTLQRGFSILITLVGIAMLIDSVLSRMA
jgi:uncharacterized membrane protein YfcA